MRGTERCHGCLVRPTTLKEGDMVLKFVLLIDATSVDCRN